MKHPINTTLVLLLMFLSAQVVGLIITSQYMEKTEEGVGWKVLPMGLERPEVEEKSSVIYIIAAIILVTVLFLVLIRLKKIKLWKIWFLLSVFACLAVSLSAFIKQSIALVISAVAALWKTFKPNMFIQNLTELFLYAGPAAIFVPILSIKAAIILLLLISLYDAYAVWKSKHMIKMAEFQTQSKVFAGLSIPYTTQKKTYKDKKTKREYVLEKAKPRTAILGGGDIGFSLIFAGVVMKTLFEQGSSMAAAVLYGIIVSVFASLGLLFLLAFSKKDKFYPAMPFITAGCLVGYLVVKIIA